MTSQNPWLVAWLLVAPLALCLIGAKMMKVDVAMAAIVFSSPLSVRVLRLAGMIAFSWLVQRFLFPKRRIASVVIFAGVFLASVIVMLRAKPEMTVVGVLWDWAYNLYKEPVVFATIVWREFATISLLALLMGAVLRFAPAPVFRSAYRLFQALIVVLCALVGVDLVYEVTVGQPPNVAVLLFSLSHPQDLAPLVGAEVTLGRVAALTLCILLPLGWAWYFRDIGTPGPREAEPRAGRGLVFALVGTAALFLPVIPVGSVPLERYAEGSLIALSKTAISAPYAEAEAAAQKAFNDENRPRWHSAGMKLQPTGAPKKVKNVVIVMMESVRAASTSIHRPDLGTTPFLAKLGQDGLVVSDMSAVVPRTSSAWIAILGGQYPLTNEGSVRWSAENSKLPRIRALPAALRDVGYATSFFTPTHLHLLNENRMVDALGFETVMDDEDFSKLQSLHANYMGGADEVMIKPILDWTRAQKMANRPFMTAVMTSVGHHPYTTPSTWKKLSFPNAANPTLEAYYNCLAYIDDVIAKLMAGYKELGVLDDTVFLFLGDHGQFFGEHGVNQAFNALYQEGVHIPMVIYAPGVAELKGVIKGPRQQIDVLPTVAELLGYEVQNARLPGVSLLQPVSAEREMFFSASIESSYLALRRGEKKYIYNFDRAPFMVFDLAADPAENVPLPAPKAAEANSLKQALLEWKIQTEMSMYARPENSATPEGRWVRR
ncbi:LTA synthase family protein [Variovorax sp. PBL-H6]|uniref:LTA synthase family protein n=1 Tax=Variovorax sp. PBL-H6 TaxID=434009 RepID=UPI0013A5AC0A|nr:LTA synthase family protein [Variovorax sp. PBL-H6]